MKDGESSFVWQKLRKSGEIVSWFCSFLLIMEMNVTGLLRVELLCFKNYWTITSLWLKCASWLFNFSDFKLGLFSIMCSTDLLFVVTLKVIEAKLSRSNKRNFNSAIKHFFKIFYAVNLKERNKQMNRWWFW